MISSLGLACSDANEPMKPWSFVRRDLRDDDVHIEITHCGVCHSDIHQARNDWGFATYPLVPGHEIVGVVKEVGSKVQRFKAGDRVGVGCMVDSCRECLSCREGHEQYCEKGMTQTYADEDRRDGSPTYGGYSDRIVVREEFVLRIPDGLDSAHAAPILCAGITTFSPLKHWGVTLGTKVGVVGLGGLGHMAVKLANALGAEVTLFTTSPEKAEEAKSIGAKHVVLSKDEEQMKAAAGTLDFVLNTVPVGHDVNPYLEVLKRDGHQVLVGAMTPLEPVVGMNLVFQRKTLAGSLIGGIAETQEVLDFCAEHGVTCDIEMIEASQINEAFERTMKGDVKYRFVIDMATLPKTQPQAA